MTVKGVSILLNIVLLALCAILITKVAEPQKQAENTTEEQYVPSERVLEPPLGMTLCKYDEQYCEEEAEIEPVDNFEQPVDNFPELDDCQVFGFNCTDEELFIFKVQDEIIRQAEEYGVNVDTAYRIADCESDFLPSARNKTSTAKGVYQFIDSTWRNNCEGNVFDYKDNIKCFMIWYPIYPSWWECK